MTEIENIDIKAKLMENFTPRKISKFVVGGSIRFVVASSITTLVPTETRVEKAKVFIGSNMIAGVIVAKANERIDAFFDRTNEEYEEIKAQDDIPEPEAVVVHTMSN